MKPYLRCYLNQRIPCLAYLSSGTIFPLIWTRVTWTGALVNSCFETNSICEINSCFEDNSICLIMLRIFRLRTTNGARTQVVEAGWQIDRWSLLAAKTFKNFSLSLSFSLSLFLSLSSLNQLLSVDGANFKNHCSSAGWLLVATIYILQMGNYRFIFLHRFFTGNMSNKNYQSLDFNLGSLWSILYVNVNESRSHWLKNALSMTLPRVEIYDCRAYIGLANSVRCDHSVNYSAR